MGDVVATTDAMVENGVAAVAAKEEAAPGKAAGAAPLFPIALRIAGRTCVVIGGGVIAARKADDLLRAGAKVRAVAPEWSAEFERLAAGRDGTVERLTRRFEPRDLDGALLVFAATDDRDAQRAVFREAAARGVLCNVVDVTDLCEFHVPATLRRGTLSISVATDGAFPLLAVKLRDHLARLVGPAFGPALRTLAAARALVRQRHPDDQAARMRRLRELLTDEALEQLLEGRGDEFERHVRSWQASLSD
jgi:precorrin-2 dehydrogenase/sirohydrochlorin ferrochelatase